MKSRLKPWHPCVDCDELVSAKRKRCIEHALAAKRANHRRWWHRSTVPSRTYGDTQRRGRRKGSK